MNEDLDPQRWRRVRAAFETALELAPAERAAWLRRELQDEPDLVAEVEALLAAEPHAAGYLTPPGTVTMDAVTPNWLLGARPGDRLGPYELLRLIGSGGMGAVFEARREKPSRTVALKVMRAGLAGDVAHRRFLDEIEVLAKLQHPGIAAVFEAGAEGDLPWFAMELLEDAKPITDWAAARQLPLHARLDLVLQVADAVQHAHQRGVIHRDLKPANILVDATGRAKVIDFGIARSLTRDLEQLTTASPGALLGTLLYMSPERLADRSDDADVRSDVYGLGVVLYELLAHRRPFAIAGQSLAEACRTILEQEPAVPSSFAPDVPRELDWIAQRALAKERDRRYATVADFAADLRRFRRHEPVLAAPPSAAYRLRKFVRRNRAGVAAAAIVLAVAVGSFAAITSALWRARDAETSERARRREAVQDAQRTEAALAFMQDMFSIASRGQGQQGRDTPIGVALDRASSNLEDRFASQPAMRAILLDTVGIAWLQLGDGEKAEHHLRSALEVHAEASDADPLEAAGIHAHLAEVLLRAGRLDEAAGELDRAEALVAAMPKAKARLALGIRRADLLRARGEKAEAKQLLTAVVEELERGFGAQDRDLLLALNLLGGVLHELGDLDGAETYYRRSLEGLTERKGEQHPDTLSAMNNLAMVLFSRRPSPASLTVLKHVLEVRARLFGDEHPDTIGTRVGVGGQCYLLGDKEAALQHWELALQHAAKLPREHPIVQTLLVNIATVERDRGNFARAIELNEEVLELRRRTLGETHDRTLVALTSLADILRQAQQIERAAELFGSGLELAARCDPPNLAAAYRCRLGIGRIATDRGEFAAAEEALLACRDGYDAALATVAVKQLLTPCDGDLVRLYELWGKPEQAAKHRAAADAAAGRGATAR